MILVDAPRVYPPHMISEAARRRGHARKLWCHMVSDAGLDELHKFAESIGLKREWFQGDHYDITHRKLSRAIENGAALVTSTELIERMQPPRIYK